MRPAACGAVVGAALVVALTGCGSGSPKAKAPSPLPITTPSAGRASAGTPTPTVDPNSDAAVIDAVRAWVDAVNTASAQATLDPLRALATAQCSCILGLSRAIDYLAQQHLHLNVRYVVQDAKVTARDRGAATVTAIVSNDPFQALNPDDSVYQTRPAATKSNEYVLKLEGDQWLIDAVV